MADHIRSLRTPLVALSAAVALTACGGNDRARDDAAMRADTAAPQFGDTSLAAATPSTTVDSTPVAGVGPTQGPQADTNVTPMPAPATPAPRREPTRANPRPAAPRPAPRPAPAPRETNALPSAGGAAAEPVARRGTIASGATLRLAFAEKTCSRTLSEGETVSATVRDGADGSNGARIPSGSRVTLVVTRSTSATNNDRPTLAFDVRSVNVDGESYPVDGRVSLDSIAIERQGGDAKKVAIGAAAGAVIGNIIGGGDRAVRTAAGAAAGGLAGAGVAAATGKRYACVPAGEYITLRLTSPVTMTVAR